MLQFITEQGMQEISFFIVRKVILVIKHNQQIKHKSKLQAKKVWEMKQKTIKDFNDQAYSLDEYKKKANRESKKFRDLRKQKRSQNWFW